MAWLKCNECACIAGVRAPETTLPTHTENCPGGTPWLIMPVTSAVLLKAQ